MTHPRLLPLLPALRGGRGPPLKTDAALSDRFMGATLRRAIIRAFMADELTLEEIAMEFSCSRAYVKKVCTTLSAIRCNLRRRHG